MTLVKEYKLVATWAKTEDGYASIPFSVNPVNHVTEAEAAAVVMGEAWNLLHTFIAEHEQELQCSK